MFRDIHKIADASVPITHITTETVGAQRQIAARCGVYLLICE